MSDWCCSQAPLDGNSHWLTFRCPKGQTVDARFEQQDDFVSVHFAGREFRLPHVIAASGARYSDGKFTFWNKGNTAMIEIDDHIVVQDCILQPQ
jgi:membrane-bound inhibitor of C-type lysozyme